jgi:hypothetical protein
VRGKAAEGGEERGQTVKHGSFCFADADADMSKVSIRSAEELSLKVKSMCSRRVFGAVVVVVVVVVVVFTF